MSDRAHDYRTCPLFDLSERERQAVSNAMKELSRRSDKGDLLLKKEIDDIKTFMANGLTKKIQETITHTINAAIAKGVWKLAALLLGDVAVVILAAWLISKLW